MSAAVRAVLLIGRLCSGKTTYAHELMARERAVLLSADALMQTMFPEPLGERYDVYSARCVAYLYRQARALVAAGVTVILDFGFWTRADRAAAVEALSGIPLDWRYLAPPEDEWRRRIAQRNAQIESGQASSDDYYVDDGLLRKLAARFEPPAASERLNETVIR